MDNKYERSVNDTPMVFPHAIVMLFDIDSRISILLSKPYTFNIGPQKKQFTIHEAAVAKLSETLDRLLNGGMRESSEHCVCWEDTDEETFIRFGEWAYTGDYKPEEPEILLDASLIAPSKHDINETTKLEPVANSLASFKIEDESEKNNTWRHYCKGKWKHSNLTADISCISCNNCFNSCCAACGSKLHTKCLQCRTGSKKLQKKQSMIEKFNNDATYASPTIPFTARKNTESCEDYSRVFLSHARLYTLADKYDIPELRNLSIHKLYVSLKEFALYADRMGDIIGLVKYSFNNTIANDKLRTLLVKYCACIVEDMCKREDFQQLINESPDFGYELIKEMGNRLD